MDNYDRLFGLLILVFIVLLLIEFARAIFFSDNWIHLITGFVMVSLALFFYIRWQMFRTVQKLALEGALNEDLIKWYVVLFSMRAPVGVDLDHLSRNPTDSRVGKEE